MINSLRRRSLRRLRSACPWPGRRRDHQPAAVQHAQELLQLVQRDFLRGKFGLEAVFDLVQADVAVEHLQDGVFFFLEAEVVQSDGFLDDPVAAAQVLLPARERSGRLRMGSFRAELESRLSCRVDHLTSAGSSSWRCSPGLRSQTPSSSVFCTSARTRNKPPSMDIRGRRKSPCRERSIGRPPAGATRISDGARSAWCWAVLGGVDEALHPEVIDADDVQHRIAGLHPFARVAMDFDDHAVQRRADLVAVEVFFGRLDLGLGDVGLVAGDCSCRDSHVSMPRLASVYFISCLAQHLGGDRPGELAIRLAG